MRPYSLDLRQKIIDTYAEGNLSQRKLAQHFRVAASFIQKLIKQYRETMSVEPKARVQQTPTKLNSDQLETLRTIVATNKDATLAELCDLLEQKVKVRIGVSTMFRMLDKLGFTLKKNTLSKSKRNRTSATEASRVLANRPSHTGTRPDIH